MRVAYIAGGFAIAATAAAALAAALPLNRPCAACPARAPAPGLQILASSRGTLMELGISPIITSGMIMQVRPPRRLPPHARRPPAVPPPLALRNR